MSTDSKARYSVDISIYFDTPLDREISLTAITAPDHVTVRGTDDGMLECLDVGKPYVDLIYYLDAPSPTEAEALALAGVRESVKYPDFLTISSIEPEGVYDEVEGVWEDDY